MKEYFVKVLHSEELSELSLNEIKGGKSCTCNGGNFTCKCNDRDLIK